ncbi:MAG TPA: flavodoxin family protein [Terracidiphilus sp.]|nr:flavodoxin family protein [Terracidiphilus sp.]
MARKVVAIVGSYRMEDKIDTAVEAILEGAREKGATTHIIYLTEHGMELRPNGPTGAEQPGEERGKCAQEDALDLILKEIAEADALVLGSPVSCGNVTAIFQQFMGRLPGKDYRPWSRVVLRIRIRRTGRKAVLVASSAMPGFLIPIFTSTRSSLRGTARVLGARPVGTMWIGLAANSPRLELSARRKARALRIGRRLA